MNFTLLTIFFVITDITVINVTDDDKIKNSK